MKPFGNRERSMTSFASCVWCGAIAMGWLVSMAVHAKEIATENSPARITINKTPTTVSIWYVDPASNDTAYVKEHFQKRLEHYGSTALIESCDPVVEMQGINTFQGMESLTPVAFAAACQVHVRGRMIEIIMCDFPMVGKFSTASSGSLDLEWFASFISANCPAGG